METDLPDLETKEAKEGTLLHHYEAHPEYDRRVLPPHLQDLLRINEQCLETILQLVLEPSPLTAREWHLETKEGLPGTPDFVMVWKEPKVALIRDSKFGFYPVERAELNLQLRAYAVMAWDNFDVESIYVAITQPRLPYAERITIARYGRPDIDASRLQIESIRKQSKAEDAPINAGEHCRYCRAKLICPAFRELAGQGLTVFDGVAPADLSKPALAEKIEKRLAECTDMQLGQMHKSAALVTMIREPMNDEIRRRITAGGMEGYSLGKASEVRLIANVKRAIACLTLAKVSTKDQLLEICELHIGGIEEQYRRDTHCTWKEARDKVNKVLKSAMEIETRKPRIISPK